MKTAAVLRALTALAPSPKATASSGFDALWLGTTTKPPLDVRLHSIESAAVVALTATPAEVVGVDGSVLADSRSILNRFASKARLESNGIVELTLITAVGTSPGPNGPVPWAQPVLRTQAVLASPIIQAGALGFSVDGVRSIVDGAQRATRRDIAGTITDDKALSLFPTRDWEFVFDLPSGDAGGLLERLFSFELTTLDPTMTGRPRMVSWIEEVAAAAEMIVDDVVWQHPQRAMEMRRESPSISTGITFCVGFALAPLPTARPGTNRHSLQEWAETPNLERSAFAAIVAPPEVLPEPRAETARHDAAPVTLTDAQRRIIDRARSAPVTVVSGAPGTGKTHTIIGLCADAIEHDRSVLIAVRSDEAATVIAEQLSRQPGPSAIRFGTPEAARITSAEIDRRLAADSATSAHATEIYNEYYAATELLDQLLVTMAAGLEGQRPSVRQLRRRQIAPGVFDPTTPLSASELDEFRELFHTAQRPTGLFGSQLFAKRRAAAARRSIAERIGSPLSGEDLDLELAHEAVEFAAAARTSRDLDEVSAELQQLWPLWREAETRRRHMIGNDLVRKKNARLRNRGARGALSTIQTALRSGPQTAQRLLAGIDRSDFAHAAPIWLGTLSDVERLLPRVAGLFDVVIIDEASQVDLAAAAPALLRGATTVIIGDPKQLRPVSFLADDAVTEAFTLEGIQGELGRLDLRRNSTWDVAASVAAVQWLDEHFRSLPHLIGFSLNEFYDRKVALATRHPTTEHRSAISLVAPGASLTTTVIVHLRSLLRSGVSDIGVVSPFRAIVDELQEAIIDTFSRAEIDQLNVMVSTVHGFQGAERRHMIVVPGVDASSPAGRRRFIENPNLFNVMVTRARQRIDLVTDLEPDATTLLGRYVQWAQHGNDATLGQASAAHANPNTTATVLNTAFVDAGIDAQLDYDVGSHTIDLVAHRGGVGVGIICGVHPDGPAAHRNRHRSLAAAGWRLIDVVAPGSTATLATTALHIAQTQLR